MKRLFYGLLGLLLAVPLAWAGTNLRQNADGTASWVDTGGNAKYVGSVDLTGQIALVHQPGSVAFAVPVTNMRVDYVGVMAGGTVTGTLPTITVQGNLTSLTGGTAKVAGTNGWATGVVLEITNFSGNPPLQRGQIISVATGGGATNAVSATVVIRLVPFN